MNPGTATYRHGCRAGARGRMTFLLAARAGRVAATATAASRAVDRRPAAQLATHGPTQRAGWLTLREAGRGGLASRTMFVRSVAEEAAEAAPRGGGGEEVEEVSGVDLPPATFTKVKAAEFVKSSVQLAQCPKEDMNTPEFAVIGRSNVGKSSLINSLTGVKNLAMISKTPGESAPAQLRPAAALTGGQASCMTDLTRGTHRRQNHVHQPLSCQQGPGQAGRLVSSGPAWLWVRPPPPPPLRPTNVCFPSAVHVLLHCHAGHPSSSAVCLCFGWVSSRATSPKSYPLTLLHTCSYAKRAKTNRLEWNSFTRDYFLQRKSLANVLLLVDASIPPQPIDLDCADWLANSEVMHAGNAFACSSSVPVRCVSQPRVILTSNQRHTDTLCHRVYKD